MPPALAILLKGVDRQIRVDGFDGHHRDSGFGEEALKARCLPRRAPRQPMRKAASSSPVGQVLTSCMSRHFRSARPTRPHPLRRRGWRRGPNCRRTSAVAPHRVRSRPWSCRDRHPWSGPAIRRAIVLARSASGVRPSSRPSSASSAEMTAFRHGKSCALSASSRAKACALGCLNCRFTFRFSEEDCCQYKVAELS